MCVNSTREGDEILFTHEGGVDVGDVDAKALKLRTYTVHPESALPTILASASILLLTCSSLFCPPSPVIPVGGPFPARETVISTLLTHVPAAKKDVLADFLIRLYAVYEELHCTYTRRSLAGV